MANGSNSLIYFRFADQRTAADARDMFDELGYDPQLKASDMPPVVAIRVIGEDLTSALEISQAYGGTLIERTDHMDETTAFAMAYDLSMSEREQERHAAPEPEPEIPGSDDGPLYDVSAETYDHFSGDVRA